MATPHQPEIERLLQLCTGSGRVIVASPLESAIERADASGGSGALAARPRPHHFYAGLSRSPAQSLLEALLLTLGGRLPNGSTRYQEVVVVNAGGDYDQDGQDKPPAEVLNLSVGGRLVSRGDLWMTWWFRKPAVSGAPAGADPATSPRGVRSKWSARPEPFSPSSSHDPFPAFSHQVRATSGVEFPKRHQVLRRIFEELSDRPHPVLLLIELATLDYESPGQLHATQPGAVPRDHRISDAGRTEMEWLVKWIDQATTSQRPLDVVFYSRNAERADAFFGQGLPRPPKGYTGGDWTNIKYTGRNVERIEFPCGAHPWGPVFTHNEEVRFSPVDGTNGDSAEGLERYRSRTLTSLLRGRTTTGRPTRLRFLVNRQAAPVPHDTPCGLDPTFWSQVDVDALATGLQAEYFGAEKNPAIQELLAQISNLRDMARRRPADLGTRQCMEMWQRSSTLMLWGPGGSGKSYLAKVLCRLLFGHEAFIQVCTTTADTGRSAASFNRAFYGSEPGLVGSEALMEAGAHLLDRRGFTVLSLDDVDGIAGRERFGECMKALYGLTFERRYSPANSQLVPGGFIPLWNCIIVLTANLTSWLPPGVSSEDVSAVDRRMSAFEYRGLEASDVLDYAKWSVCRALEGALDGVAVCHCGDVTRELARLNLEARTPQMIDSALRPYVERARDMMVDRGITPDSAPRFLDVTELLRAAVI